VEAVHVGAQAPLAAPVRRVQGARRVAKVVTERGAAVAVRAAVVAVVDVGEAAVAVGDVLAREGLDQNPELEVVESPVAISPSANRFHEASTASRSTSL